MATDREMVEKPEVTIQQEKEELRAKIKEIRKVQIKRRIILFVTFGFLASLITVVMLKELEILQIGF